MARRLGEPRARRAGYPPRRAASRRTHTLRLAETFTIARGSSDEETVVQVELEHDGIIGDGEGAPVDFWGESPDSMVAFLEPRAPRSLGDDPWPARRIAARLAALEGNRAPRWRSTARSTTGSASAPACPCGACSASTGATPPTSYTIGIDSVEGTADKTRRAQRYGVLKVKVGGADDLARLEASREHRTRRCASTATRAGRWRPRGS